MFIYLTGILANRCTCARGARFDEHVATDCLGAGVFTLTPLAHFQDEGEVLATLLHATKCQLFSLLRTCPVLLDGIMRVNIDADMPTVARVTATLHNWTSAPGERSCRTGNDRWDQTDKHKYFGSSLPRWCANTFKGW